MRTVKESPEYENVDAHCNEGKIVVMLMNEATPEGIEDLFSRFDEVLFKEVPEFRLVGEWEVRLERCGVMTPQQLGELLDEATQILLPYLPGKDRQTFHAKHKAARDAVDDTKQSTGKVYQRRLVKAQKKVALLAAYIPIYVATRIHQFLCTGHVGAYLHGDNLAWLIWRCYGQPYFFHLWQLVFEKSRAWEVSTLEKLQEKGQRLAGRATKLPFAVRTLFNYHGELSASLSDDAKAYSHALFEHIGKPPAALKKYDWFSPFQYKNLHECNRAFEQIDDWFSKIEAIPPSVWKLIERDVAQKASESTQRRASEQQRQNKRQREEQHAPPRQNTPPSKAQDSAEILGVSLEGLTPETLKSAWRRACLKYHPDRVRASWAEARRNEKMKAINAAKEYLEQYLAMAG